MYDERAPERLVEDIYAAAVNPALWPAALDAIGDALGGAVLVTSVHRSDGAAFVATHRLDPARDAILRERFASIETNLLMAQMPRLPVQAVVGRDDVVAPEIYARSALFNEVFRPQGLEHAALCCLARENGVLMPLGALRRSGAEFDVREAGLLESLLPHLRRALAMTVRLRDAEREATAMLIVADAAERASMLLDGEGRLAYANEAAHALLAEGDAIALRGGRLALAAGNGRRLAQFVEHAATRPGGCGGAMAIERADGLRLALLVTPAAGPAGDGPLAAGSVLVTAIVVGARQIVPVERLMQLFGLTQAEAEVVNVLLAGGTPETIASERRVSLATVRSQLSAIYAKTGVASATHLMRLLGPLTERRVGPPGTGPHP